MIGEPMKQIKIYFMGFWSDFDYNNFIVYQILKKNYNVVVESDPAKADYIICSVFDKPFQYCSYPQVRIFYSGENYAPDFNLVDYAISPYPISYFDRSFCYSHFGDPARFTALETKNRNYPTSILSEKPFFANFIFGHESEHHIRGDFFRSLSKYRRVDSAGPYMNNMPNGKCVDYKVDKTDFQKKYKFTICIESTAHRGFITEKIVDAFFSDTIPIYYGSDTIGDIFNPGAFIDLRMFGSYEDAVELIAELDSNDDLYLEMLRQPIFRNSQFVTEIHASMETFLKNIFDQPKEEAFRRSRVFAAKNHNDYMKKVVLPEDISGKELLKLLFTRLREKLHQKKE